ncbi:hypothetical protein J7M23_05270 [Candidatus Sumerlaeota bacterium]|nr:hypothetical protein [Candidatus Sumerlaeota bacterium]
MQKSKQVWLIIILLAILNFPYSVVVYNHIGEDAFITFRYVENVARGEGLVYNPGERVEGFSNFLWLMILVVFRLLGLDVLTVSKVLAAGANSGLMIFCTLLLRSLLRALAERRYLRLPSLVLVLPALFIFFNPMLHYHADRGLETCFYAMLLVMAGWLFAEQKWIPAGLGFSAVALTRPEGIFYAGVALLFLIWLMIWQSKTNASLHYNQLLKFVVPIFVLFGGFLIWRRLYFGYWLPNTVYAKVSKLNFYYNPSTGLLWQFIKSWSFLPVIAVAGSVVILFYERDFRLRWRLLFLLALPVTVLLYTLGIGYILAAPFRHYVPSVPFFIVLLSFLCAYAYTRRAGGRARLLVSACIIILLGLNFYTYNNLDMPRSRLHCRTIDFLKHRDFKQRWEWYLEPPVWLGAEVGRWLNQNIPHNALLAADQMGQLGYYSGHHIIDLLGLMDTEIAHSGYSTQLLLRRNPDYVVWYGLNGEPYLPQFKQTAHDPKFRQRYTLLYILRAKNELDRTEYLVFARKDLLQGHQQPAPEILYLGLNTQEFIHRWRI